MSLNILSSYIFDLRNQATFFSLVCHEVVAAILYRFARRVVSFLPFFLGRCGWLGRKLYFLVRNSSRRNLTGRGTQVISRGLFSSHGSNKNKESIKRISKEKRSASHQDLAAF